MTSLSSASDGEVKNVREAVCTTAAYYMKYSKNIKENLHPFSSNQFFCKFKKVHVYQCYQCKNTVIKNIKIQLIIMDIIQSYHALSNKNNEAELMFLFNIGLSCLINKLSLISNKNLLVP